MIIRLVLILLPLQFHHLILAQRTIDIGKWKWKLCSAKVMIENVLKRFKMCLVRDSFQNNFWVEKKGFFQKNSVNHQKWYDFNDSNLFRSILSRISICENKNQRKKNPFAQKRKKINHSAWKWKVLIPILYSRRTVREQRVLKINRHYCYVYKPKTRVAWDLRNVKMKTKPSEKPRWHSRLRIFWHISIL